METNYTFRKAKNGIQWYVLEKEDKEKWKIVKVFYSEDDCVRYMHGTKRR